MLAKVDSATDGCRCNVAEEDPIRDPGRFGGRLDQADISDRTLAVAEYRDLSDRSEIRDRAPALDCLGALDCSDISESKVVAALRSVRSLCCELDSEAANPRGVVEMTGEAFSHCRIWFSCAVLSVLLLPVDRSEACSEISEAASSSGRWLGSSEGS
ncbi:hypothetical protein CJO79_13200 [Ralstonia solanacearum]|nr:hypothetical protein CJO76_13220 [Ralstonia solanacearum]AXV91865.1 hypothetical protein CJO79_13200 [Ralstonia solanacearum]AXW19957.1 hypothetical protein CJO85_13255 [Ralstonia solanacearum]AXW76752.1 hypothetical protein CJO97_13190 [Ralstonia solanacearum]